MAFNDCVSNSSNNTELNNDIFTCFERICSMLKVLNSIIDINTTLRVRLLACQCTARATKIIRSIGFNCTVSHTILIPDSLQILNLAVALHSLALSLVTIRQSCGDGSYSLSMLLWSACESLSCLMDMMPNNKNGNDENILSHHGKNSRTIIFDSLRLTAPSPNDLYTEIHRIQNSKGNNIVLDEIHSNKNSNHGGPYNFEKRGSGGSVDRRGGGNYTDGVYDGEGWSGYGNIAGDTGTEGKQKISGLNRMKSFQGMDSFKLQYILDGLQMMLRAGILDDKKQKQR